MTSLEYSTDALNVIPKFYNVDLTVYVEGDSDVAFWEEILKHFSKNKITVRAIPTGGKTKLQEYISDIISGDLDAAAVACDLDYQAFQNPSNRISHPNVLFTYGYSIENSLYLPEVVADAICHTGGISRTKVDKKDFEKWLLDFVCRLKLLMIYDIAANTIGPKQEGMGLNCTRFMRSRTSHQIDDNKVKNYMLGLNKLPSNKRNSIQQKINQLGLSAIFWVRGHFLQSAVLKYINNEIKRLGSNKNKSKKMGNDSLLAYATSHFVKYLPNRSKHYLHYKNQTTTLIQAHQGQ